MSSDPIVEEVKKLRLQYIEKFKYHLPSIFADLRKKEKERTQQGWTAVELPLPSSPGK